MRTGVFCVLLYTETAPALHIDISSSWQIVEVDRHHWRRLENILEKYMRVLENGKINGFGICD